MRIVISLLKASAVAAFAFALAWIRIPITASTVSSTLGIFVVFSFVFSILSLMVGLPLVVVAERIGISRWWSYALIAALTGAAIASAAGRHPTGEVENPHGGMVFSPFTRDHPGIDSYPTSSSEYFDSVVFCAAIGGILGLAFWFFHSRDMRSSHTLKADTDRRTQP